MASVPSELGARGDKQARPIVCPCFELKFHFIWSFLQTIHVWARTWRRSMGRCTPASRSCPRTSSDAWSTLRSAARCTGSCSGSRGRPGPGARWSGVIIMIGCAPQERQGAGGGWHGRPGVLAVHVAGRAVWPRVPGLAPPPLLSPRPQHRLWMRHDILAPETQTRVHQEIW